MFSEFIGTEGFFNTVTVPIVSVHNGLNPGFPRTNRVQER